MCESEGQGRLSWLLLVAMLAMLDVLSIGPEHWLMYRGLISQDVHRTLMDTAYHPLLLLADVNDKADYTLDRYVVLFYP